MNTDPVAIVHTANPIAELAEQICSEHAAAVAAVRKGIDHARAAGELLLIAKKLCAHGQWLPWLEKHLPDVGARQAQKYMLLAAKWNELPPAPNANSGSHFESINGALAILAEPSPIANPVDQCCAALGELNLCLELIHEDVKREVHVINIDSMTALGELLNAQEQR